MRAYLIDPEARTITETEYNGDYHQIYEHIKADLFDVVYINEAQDCVFVDDEGLMKEPEYFFLVRGYDQPLAGRGLVLGTRISEGETIGAKCSLEWLKRNIAFVSRNEMRKMVLQGVYQ